ncbi:MAG: universal stress protein [Saprospiraceae bacterium]|nr:universal stress protein [Saprospiraceae bacterium]
MKKILFPTDFSEAADRAFIYALNVADKLDAGITTVHAYHLPYVKAMHLPQTLKEVYDSIVIEEFDNYRDHVPRLRELATAQGLGQVPLHHVMVEAGAGVVRAILGVARDDQSEMIIMGTTGASGLREIFLGSVAAEILENASCPVLAVPVRAVFDGAIDKIAMTTEFAPGEKMALVRLLRFADLFHADVYVVHVDTAHTEQFARRMDTFTSDLDHPNLYHQVIDALDVEPALARFIEEYRIDVLAMLTHKRNALQELFTYSMTKKMAYHLRVPILAFHGQNADAVTP